MLLCRQSSFWHQFPKPHWTHDKTLWTISYLFHFYKNTGCRLPHPLLLMMPGITLGKQDNVVQGFLEKISVAIIWQFPKSTALRKKRTMKQLRKKILINNSSVKIFKVIFPKFIKNRKGLTLWSSNLIPATKPFILFLTANP